MKIIIAIALLTLTMPVNAGITAFAVSDCAEWIQKPADHRKAWLMGYLSGQNALWQSIRTEKAVENPLSALKSAQQAYLWMDKYCQENPLESVADGADILFLQLITKK